MNTAFDRECVSLRGRACVAEGVVREEERKRRVSLSSRVGLQMRRGPTNACIMKAFRERSMLRSNWLAGYEPAGLVASSQGTEVERSSCR